MVNGRTIVQEVYRWMSITNGGLTVDDFEEHFVL
ncbi:hypothetical protein IHE45_01G049100 [Dioscorea alata]|uniref:Uncharacterized protein n=1 Tax=Dioscorea alata TaxID=55571 RepID=A0ACB7WUR2_DIOAL|nr:hypothetical protein IHE45_01G049100 [Dioscorea alata]